MSSRPRKIPENLLDAHLDGLLDDSAQREFQRELPNHTEWPAQIDQQKRIDEALRRVARPGDPEAVWARVLAAQRAGRVEQLCRAARRIRHFRLAAAAVLVLCLGGAGWLAWSRRTPESTYYAVGKEQPWRSLETVYRDEVQAGFKADWECKSDREFASTFWGRFNQGLLLGTLPDGVKSLGLSYSNSLSIKTTDLLARVHGQPVIVFVDRIRAEREQQQLPPNSELHLYRREVGKLVLYELSPLDRPYVLDSFYIPDKPASWYQP